MSGSGVTESNISSWARTRFRSIDTFSSDLVARINGTWVTVVAISFNIRARSGGFVALSIDAIVGRFAFWSVGTSLSFYIRINGTWVVIIARRLDTFTDSTVFVTSVRCSSRNDITDNWLVNTSSAWVTESLGTFVLCFTYDRSLNESFDRMTFGDETFVGFFCNNFCRNVFKDAFPSLDIARVSGTNVVIVTYFRNVNTTSGISVTAISSTCIVVITVLRNKLALSGN